MSLWLVRAGKYGEQEETALKENVVTIGWRKDTSISRTYYTTVDDVIETVPEIDEGLIAKKVAECIKNYTRIKLIME
jgi:predicted Mrr-cat superfamily restriction endonuclease